MANVINATSTGNGGLISTGDDSGILNIQTNETTAITITAAQNIGIGTATPTDDGGYGKIVDIYGSTGGAVYLHTSTATNYAFLGKYNSSTQLADSGSAGLTFATASGSTPVERMRINSSGAFLYNKTAIGVNISGIAFRNDAGTFIELNQSTNGNAGIYINCSYGSGTQTFEEFRYSNSAVGSITSSGTTTSYNVTSDYRLKENIVPLTSALDKILQLKPRTYNYKSKPEEKIEGFIAHELQSVIPHAVTGEKDAVNADGNPVYQGVDASFLIPHLTAAIQELKQINDTQAETINALTARIVALETA